MEKVNVIEKFDQVHEYWSPKVVGELNKQQVKLAKLKGEFIWHHHEHEDELFFILKGKLRMEYRDKVIELGENEMVIVPKGVEHKPVAEEEVWIMLFEPATTLNTGNIINDRTKNLLDKI